MQIFYPPYAATGAHHTVLNCDFKVSQSRMAFNDAYGIDFLYKEKQILYFYAKGHELAGKLMGEGAVVLMKVMKFDGSSLHDHLFTLTRFYGFRLLGKHYSLDKSKSDENAKKNTFSDIGSSVVIF